MGRPKTYDREEVLRRAMNLFWKKGYEGAHLKELVQIAGINRFSLYSEFGGKEGLYREAIRLYLGELRQLLTLLEREPLGVDNILDLFRAETRERFHHGCFALNTLIQRPVVPDDVAADVDAAIDGMERSLLRNVKAAQAAGDIDPALTPGGLARLITAINIGLLSYEIHAPGPNPRRTVLQSLEDLLRGSGVR